MSSNPPASAAPIPPADSILLPSVGDIWCWEPLKDHARADVRVTAVEWNGEEWWVECEDALLPDKRYKNELSRWYEATVLMEAASE